MSCSICFAVISWDTQAAVVGRTLPRVNGTIVAAHLPCYCLRQAITDAAVAAAAIVSPHTPLPVSTKELIPDDAAPPQCSICRTAVGMEAPFVSSPTCAHRFVHLACCELVGDMTRRWSCPVCPPTVADNLAALDAWARPRKGDYPQIPQTPPGLFAPTSRAVIDRCNEMPTLLAVEKRMPVGAIVASYEERARLVTCEPRHATVGKWIVSELRQENALGTPVGILEFLTKHGYSAEDIQRLGITLEMAMHYSSDRAILLDRKVFPAHLLAQPPFNTTFFDLALNGRDTLARFCRAGYRVSDLSYLRFTMRGFVAAGGTRADFDALCATDGVNALSLYDNFQFTEEMEAALKKHPETK